MNPGTSVVLDSPFIGTSHSLMTCINTLNLVLPPTLILTTLDPRGTEHGFSLSSVALVVPSFLYPVSFPWSTLFFLPTALALYLNELSTPIIVARQSLSFSTILLSVSVFFSEFLVGVVCFYSSLCIALFFLSIVLVQHSRLHCIFTLHHTHTMAFTATTQIRIECEPGKLHKELEAGFQLSLPNAA